MSTFITPIPITTMKNIGKHTDFPPRQAESPTQALRFGLDTDAYTPLRQETVSHPAGAYGIRNVGVQSYLPIADRRALAPEEDAQVQRGLSRWWPKLFPHYGTPASELLASPAKSALMTGAVSGGLATLLLMSHPAGLLISAGIGLLGGVLSYFSRQQKNGNILDMMKRLPTGASRRDLLSDPVYQADLNRTSTAGGGGFADSLATGMMLNSLFSPGRSAFGRPSGFRAPYRGSFNRGGFSAHR